MPKARKRSFTLTEGRCADDNHVRITDDMMTHPAFLKLSSGAKVLYIYLRGWAKGREKVSYAVIMAKPFMSKNAFMRARDELIEAGFIYWHNKPKSSNQRNETALFEFTDTWHTGKSRSIPE